MKVLALVTLLLFSGFALSAETAKQPKKSVKKETVAKKNTPSKSLAVPDSFKVGDKICYKYNPNNPVFFENTVKSVTDSEIVWSSELKNAKDKKEPHDEKYTPAELKDFLGKVKLVPCK
jgi:hypothetical protein